MLDESTRLLVRFQVEEKFNGMVRHLSINRFFFDFLDSKKASGFSFGCTFNERIYSEMDYN